jgi:hypothetical protein
MIRAANSSWSAEVVPDPDSVLVLPGPTVATSDAGILDHCESWVGLARAVIETWHAGAFVIDLGCGVT